MYGSDNNNITLTHNFVFSQPQGRNIPRTWMLLDNQSTVDVFVNSDLLRNIRNLSCHLDLHCNAGTRRIHTVGDLPGYGTVWYDPDGISNILSMSRVIQKYHVSFDSEQGNTFIVTKPDGTTFEFIQSDAVRSAVYSLKFRPTKLVISFVVLRNWSGLLVRSKTKPLRVASRPPKSCEHSGWCC
jgi:hypothetical protein